MTPSAASWARALLGTEGSPSGSEILRIHWFADDEAAHDDARIEELYAEFTTDFERAGAELTKAFGPPAQVGQDDVHDCVPISGVFLFATWDVGGRSLFLAVAHEDREVPIMLTLGVSEADP